MSELFRSPLTYLWILLLTATALSIGLAESREPVYHVMVTAAVLIIAVLKMHVIGMYFMELRHAPKALRCAFHAWCVFCGGMLITPYILG